MPKSGDTLAISIIMPVFNAGSFLEECLESIINQSLQTWELVAIDDFSTDNSQEILKRYTKIDKRINCFSNSEKGIIPALKLAFSKSIHPLITRMDADDIMPLNKLQNLSDKLVELGPKHISTGKVKYFSNQALGNGFLKYEQWINGMVDKNTHFDNIYQECVIPSACWMAFREDLMAINAFDESEYPEDYDLVFRMYRAGYQISSSKEILHLWRDHPTRASRTDDNYSDQNFFHLKVKYFIELEYDKDKTLFLWGAGRKGKNIAKLLIQNDHAFRWVSNNEQKIGKNIYGKNIESSNSLSLSKTNRLLQQLLLLNFKLKKQIYLRNTIFLQKIFSNSKF